MCRRVHKEKYKSYQPPPQNPITLTKDPICHHTPPDTDTKTDTNQPPKIAFIKHQQMHLKSATNEKSLQQSAKTMASFHGEDGGGSGEGGGGGGGGDGGRTSRASSNNNNNNSCSSNNNNNNNKNNNETNSSANPPADPATPDQIKLKRETLEQRKQELERLLSEKSWLLQQLQKQETQILNGNFEYMNLNEIFANLAQQYKTEQGGGSGGSGGGTSILRRKTVTGGVGNTKENQNTTNNNNILSQRRQSDALSNRSSEYDNYPGGGGGSVEGVAVASQQMPSKLQQQSSVMTTAQKKRGGTPIVTNAANYNYMQLQRQQLLQQHVEQQMLQQHVAEQQLLQQHAAEQALLQQHAAEQQMLQQHLQYAAEQQRKQHKMLLQHAAAHYQQQQQLASPQQHVSSPQHLATSQQYLSPLHLTPQHTRHLPPSSHAADGISLYSVNSANVATLRQQHVAPQQQPQPIVVQCDKYYLSPTSHTTSYSDGGGFIKSSQNIKKYISPLASPTSPQHHQQQHQQNIFLQQHTRALDAISLAPSYSVSMDESGAGAATHNLRWRSQSHIAAQPPPAANAATSKSHSSDMLAQLPHVANTAGGGSATFYYTAASVLPLATSHLKPPPPPKPHDEISISSHNSGGELSTISASGSQKSLKPKPKQWLESSLDGPIIRAPLGVVEPPPPLKPHSTASHPKHKLSSQSMSAHSSAPMRHYSMSAGVKPSSLLAASGASKLLQDDDGRYAKLSQSTSYLNSLAAESSSGIGGGGGGGGGGVSISPAYLLDAELATFKYLPPKLAVATATGARLTPPPRPPPAGDKTRETAEKGRETANAPDIRIESPKNMTVVQQATFQPYKEVTKPFEMSDFYKYSTKFRQKEAAGSSQAD